MSIIKLNGVVKEYAWGNDDYIPSLIGGFDGKPKAELWMGSHKSGEATLLDGEKLSDYLSSHKAVFSGSKLPLLFKVLAIKEPLSLQCHPNKAQAEEGWKREEEKRAKGEVVNYQDDNEKAEIIAAITPITAMCGFRSLAAIKANLEHVAPKSYEKLLSGFCDIKSLFFGLYKLSECDKKAIIDELKSFIENTHESSWKGNFLTEKGILKRLLRLYPDDIGVLSPYILNVVHLNVGEALYLEPGTLHAYVLGNGVELMSASDNVLRGGLTKKHMDLQELGNIMKFDETVPEKVPTHSDSASRKVYETPSPSFRLVAAPSGEYLVKSENFALAIVIEGVITIKDGNERLQFNKGDIFMIGEDVDEYSMRVRGMVYFAEVPK